MHPFNRPHIRTRQQGQTLIIALIVLGVLLILGLVFLGLIDRNIRNAARSQRRSESADLAEAGVRYALGQLVSSPLGADWRGVPTDLTTNELSPSVTGDPDAYYLRPKSALKNLNGTTQGDLGGPDGLGPFIRVQFPAGRALIRVRYGASDASPTKAVPGGPLRNLGASRAYLIIEAVGRTGVVNPNDPTTLNTTGGLKYRNFATQVEFNRSIAALAQADSQLVTSRRMVGYATVGITEAARFETNLYNSTAPIQLGIADGLSTKAFDDVAYKGGTGTINQAGVSLSDNLELQLGTAGSVSVAGKPTNQAGFGSLIVNGNVELYGNTHVYANRTLGDGVRIAGAITGGDGARLTITGSGYDPLTNGYKADAADQILTATGTEPGATGSFDSSRNNFSTANGLVQDGAARTDQSGFPSGVGRLVPPSTQTIDPQTKLNRYVALTRESGTGAPYGHGGGVFVDNVSDRQEALDANGRRILGSQQSLIDDILNPNNGQANSGWKGPFYEPRGASLQFLPDGFIIQRDGSAPASERTWKSYTGAESGQTTIRYRIGVVNGQLYIVDSLTPNDPANPDGAKIDINSDTIDFTKGRPFNGVLYFEGNVRVRGTIPTSVQMTLVSNATVYVDGSITKGVVNNDVTGGNHNAPINALPTASLMLMAKDNVVVNTTMFFGPAASQSLESVNDTTGSTSISPVRVRASGSGESGQLLINFDLLLDDTSGPANQPDQWLPYTKSYVRWDATAAVPTELLLAHTMDDGTAAASFLALDVNFGTTGSAYAFSTGFNAADLSANGLSDNLIENTAFAYLYNYPFTGTAPTDVPIYGIGGEPWQRYARFETRSFPLVPVPGTSVYDAAQGLLTPTGQNYKLLTGLNDLLFRPGAIPSVSTNDELIGRVAIAPSDIRIEASMFAEQGSFLIVPGPWFNPNANDTHVAFVSRVAQLRQAPTSLSQTDAIVQASRERLEAYGTAPGVPFYGEPLDVRLTVVGSVAENLPPPISVQSEWVRKWGWIPRRIAAVTDTSGIAIGIPQQHVPGRTLTDKTTYLNTRSFVPNLIVQYDPILATGRVNDLTDPNKAILIRTDTYGRPLPPMPRLPVSPKLSYFGDL